MTDQELDRQKRLEAIRQREQGATPGPWISEWENLTYQGAVAVHDPQQAHGFRRIAYAGSPGSKARQPEHRANAVFIAHARADVPWLLDEVARLEALLREGVP